MPKRCALGVPDIVIATPVKSYSDINILKRINERLERFTGSRGHTRDAERKRATQMMMRVEGSSDRRNDEDKEDEP